MENKSQFDHSRKTVGAIYRDAKMNNSEDHVECGDMTNSLMKDLVEDINDTIVNHHYLGCPFYVQVTEKKDLAMKTVIHREIYVRTERPWPEQNTLVFWVDPASNIVKFCWDLPDVYLMDNFLANPDFYDHQMLEKIKAWKRVDLYHFGFRKDREGNWEENPHYDGDLEMKPKSVVIDNLVYHL